MVKISRQFRIAVKLSEIPAWRIAYGAGVHPNVLSKIMTGALRVKAQDGRVVRIGNLLGLVADECFEREEEGP